MDATVLDLKDLTDRQLEFFRKGHNNSHHFRTAMLDMLEQAIKAYADRIAAALKADLAKPEAEAWTTEIGPVLHEIAYLRKRVKGWMGRKRVGSGLNQLLGRSYVQSRPYGRVLVLSPWNYPFQLAMMPVVTAIAAGNTVILKPSEFAPATAQVMTDLVHEYFTDEFLAVVLGDAEVAKACLASDVDFVFFTGSTALGRVIGKSCGERLIPAVLELGGKSPVVIMDDADFDLAARRLVWAKSINAGQTCVAPDYVYVPRERMDDFVTAWKRAMAGMFGADYQGLQAGTDYCKIVSPRHFSRLQELLQGGTVLDGGKSDEAGLFMEPTLLGGVSSHARVMEEEIFGPLLPLMAYDDVEDVFREIWGRPTPLAFYVFGGNIPAARRFMERFRFGGGGINDLILHVANSNLPFGGVGPSGVGRYHGKAGFDALSYQQGVVEGSAIDLSLRYPPFDQKKTALIKKFVG